MLPECDVAVIGLGPVGAVLANLLALQGLAVQVFEQAAEIYDLPRAVHFDDEAMRLFQTIGIAEQVADVSRINAGMRFVDPDGRLLLDWPRPQEAGPQGWHPSWRFHQPDLERLLRTRLDAQKSARVHLGWRVTGLEEGGDRVHLTAEHGTKQCDIAARYVIGCDGGRSFVRDRIGGGIEDFGFHERWLVVDAQLRRDRPDLGDFTVQHCHPSCAATYVRGPGQRRRWEIALGNLELDDPSDHAAIWPHLSRWLQPGDADIERAAIYTFHSMIARRWRRERLLICGDAAHQMPPFMGQGLCAGLRDASNLAWKIALVCRGHRDDLLETYQSERQPHVQFYIEGAMRLGSLINASDPDAALRGAFLQPDGTRKMTSSLARIGPGLGGDCTASGYLSAQPLLRDGRRLDARVGYAPALVADAEIANAVTVPQRISVVAAEELESGSQFLQDLGVRAVLIRPDRYVLGCADDPEAAHALIDRLPVETSQP